MISQTVKNVMITLLALIVTLEVSAIGSKVEAFLDNANRASLAVADYAEVQKEQLTSERSQKAIQAGIEAAAIYNASGRFLNTQVLPAARDSFKELGGSARQTTALLRELTQTAKQVNTDILPEIAATARAFKTTPAAIESVLFELRKTLQDVDAIVASPEWGQALKNIEALTANINSIVDKEIRGSARSIEEALQNAPSIAKSLEKIAKTSSRYSQATILANIIGILVKAFWR